MEVHKQRPRPRSCVAWRVDPHAQRPAWTRYEPLSDVRQLRRRQSKRGEQRFMCTSALGGWQRHDVDLRLRREPLEHAAGLRIEIRVCRVEPLNSVSRLLGVGRAAAITSAATVRTANRYDGKRMGPMERHKPFGTRRPKVWI